jgi:deazaflavin-dependent oxidoreductase (nitroreductase family)
MPIPKRVRYFNKCFTNRLMGIIAGKRFSPIALVIHAGRHSGKTYRTPIMVQPLPTGFAFALTYGCEVDWYQNVLTAGRCELRWHGKVYLLAHPITISQAEGLANYPNPQRMILKQLKINDFFNMEFTPGGQSG